MEYLIDRSLFYYFLMREISDVGADAWEYIARLFCVSAEEIGHYKCVLDNAILDEMSTTFDVDMYKNFMGGPFIRYTSFGEGERDKRVIEAKALALQKLREFFGDMQIKANRLCLLSEIYERDGAACVLYAIYVLHFNKSEQCAAFAEDLLVRKLKEDKNSDAGLIALGLKSEGREQIAYSLLNLPDMLIRPEMTQYLADRYGGSTEIKPVGKRVIGF